MRESKDKLSPLVVSLRGLGGHGHLLYFWVSMFLQFLYFDICAHLGFVVATSEGSETRALAWISLETLLAGW